MTKAKATTPEQALDEWRAQKGAQEAAEPVQAPKAKAAPKRPAPEIIERVPSPSGPSRMLVVDNNGTRGTVQQVQSYNPAQLVAQAIQSGADVEVIEKLGDIAWKWQERSENARKRAAFDRAMALAQGEFGPIVKNRRVHFKSSTPGKADTDYLHEDLNSVISGIKPALSKHGIFFRFRTEQPEKGQVSVTCVLTHEEGHYEENTLTAAVDVSGNKNHIQAVMSAATYLSRYTLKTACGIAATEDDDGRAAGDADPDKPVEYITPEQVNELDGLLLRKGRPLDKFLEWAGVDRLSHVTPDLFKEAQKIFAKVADKQP